jgi:hypothetical protein
LQGYELGLLTVGMVLTFALLALPRASVPETLPLPRIDRAEARQSAKTERELAAQAEATGLPFELRAVGESIRHFGRSVVHGLDTQHDRQDIHERLAAALAKGQGPLLVRLRAVQTEYFLRALGQSAHLGPKERGNPDLDELGGDFLAHAKQNGWLDAQGQFLADDATRRVLFHMHWADLVEKRSTFPFAATLNEWRIYYRFLLEHPELGALQSGDSAADTQRLRVVNALSRKDPDYPRFFAKGYLLYRLGDREAAAAAYRAQLGQNGSGRYALLTRNYLIHTLQGGESE